MSPNIPRGIENVSKKAHTHRQFNAFYTFVRSALFFLFQFVKFLSLLSCVISRLDNVSDVIDDSMPAPGRTLDGDELVDDV